MNNKIKRHNAFTLAEVLITLAIIGVVAAMTLPTLMAKYREDVTMNKLKKFYTTMQQAQLMSINDNGPTEYWDLNFGNTNEEKLAWYNKYFGKYLNTAEVLDAKILDENGIEQDDDIYVKFSDGTVFRIWNHGNVHFFYYTNYKTFLNKTCEKGKDIFVFYLNTTTENNMNIFSTYGRSTGDSYYDINELKNDYHYGCYSENKDLRNFCARLLEINGWKVPDDYPYKF